MVGRATLLLVQCRVPYPAAVVLARLLPPSLLVSCGHVYASLICRTGNFIFASSLALLVFSCDLLEAWFVLVRPVHRVHRVRQAVWRVTPNSCLAKLACYLRCSGMNSEVGSFRCRKRVLVVACSISCSLSPPFFTPQSLSSRHTLVLHTKMFYFSDLVILSHVSGAHLTEKPR
jgi:hypothetical protein